MPLEVFDPMTADTTALAATNATGNAAINVPASSAGSLTVRVYNSGTVTIFIAFGGSTVVATTAKMPIPAGNTEVFSIGAATYIAGITASGSGTLYVTPGRGC